jgi:hypothetical protein
MPRITISVSEYILTDVIGNPKNVSERVKDLLIQGYLCEKEKELKTALKSSNTDMGTKLNLVRAYLFFRVKRWLH